MDKKGVAAMDESNKKIQLYTQRSYSVVKSNEIIRQARYNLNITELKALSFIISKVKPTDKELQEYTFSIADFCKVCGIKQPPCGREYKMIKDRIKGLRDKSFWITDENGNEILVGWLSKARINKGSGKITVRLDEDMQKYVLGLFENYTQYELLATLPMKSSYSFRIFEILKSYAFIGHHTFSIDELKKLLQCEQYSRFPDFRRKVLEIATKEINTYSDIQVSWEVAETIGRKVTKIKFYIKQLNTFDTVIKMNTNNEQLDGQLSIDDYIGD